jgi:hypothetical protein
MHQNLEERVKEIDKEFKKVQLFEMPGPIMVGLGLYGKFGADGGAFHPFLNDPTNINILLIIGGMIMAWGVSKSVALLREKANLQKEHEG